MSKVEKSIDVEVPVETAYNQWTQFEEFPRFMEGVKEVHQVDDARLTWVADVGGRRKEWFARIVRQVPDEIIEWQSEGGVQNNGIVTFHRKGPDRTEIDLTMDYDPQDFVESVGDKLGMMSRQVEGDLKRFKDFIEHRGAETGAWRGKIEHGQPASGQGSSSGMGGSGSPMGSSGSYRSDGPGYGTAGSTKPGTGRDYGDPGRGESTERDGGMGGTR